MTDPFLIVSPEKVVLSYRSASVASRGLAQLLDLLIIGSVAYAVLMVAAASTMVVGTTALMFASFLLPVMFFGYFALSEGFWRGQTIGKKAASIRVVMHDGTPVTLLAATYRNLMRLVDFMPGIYLVGVLAMFMNPRSQRFGDLVAGTIVIADPPPRIGFTPAPHRVGVHRFESTVGELRQMTLEEYQALKRLCDRFASLPPETQEWSVHEIWLPFAERHGIEGVENVHAIYQMQAVVMKYGRMHNLI